MKKRGPPGHPEPRDTLTALALAVVLGREAYFWVTALLATPPPADFTQTVVGLKVVVARKAQLPVASRVVVPSTRNSPVPTTSSARLIVTVSAPAAGGGGATAFTTWVTV